jgi:hypothetical protein
VFSVGSAPTLYNEDTRQADLVESWSSTYTVSEFRCRVKSSKCCWISQVQLVESDSSSAVETVSGFRSGVGLVAFCWFFFCCVGETIMGTVWWIKLLIRLVCETG